MKEVYEMSLLLNRLNHFIIFFTLLLSYLLRLDLPFKDLFGVSPALAWWYPPCWGGCRHGQLNYQSLCAALTWCRWHISSCTLDHFTNLLSFVYGCSVINNEVELNICGGSCNPDCQQGSKHHEIWRKIQSSLCY